MRSGRFDVRAGVDRVAHMEPAFRLSLLACTDCGRCDDLCAAHQGGSTLSPRQLMQTLRSCNGSLLDGAVSPQALWACTTCGACASICPVLARPLDAVLPLRRELVDTQRIETAQSRLLSNLLQSQNTYGTRRAAGGRATAEECVFWTGCAGAGDERVARLVRATLRILRAAGLCVERFDAEQVCCGDPARRMGEEGLFQQLALRNIETLRQHGVRRVITHCTHCLNVLRNESPRCGANFEVLHHSEALALAMSKRHLPLRASSITITFHDACYAGRCNGIYNAPRKILKAVPGLTLREMQRTREHSFCCGAGGGRYWCDVSSPARPATLRMAEARATGASVLAVACPFCLKTLEAEATDLAVRDVAEIVSEALEERL